VFFAKKTGDIYIMVHYNITFKAFSLCLLIGLFTCAFSVSAQDNAKPSVVTSIKPLAIIVKSAFKDRVRVEYIMPAARSPHDVVIKLSDMRKLSAADLVFWIGPEFETRAAKQFVAVSENKRVAAMALIDSEQTLTATDSHDHDHSHDVDPHIWLSPTLATQLVAALSQRLSIKAETIFSQQAEKKVTHLLAKSKNSNYVVHHQAYGYFIEEFDLQHGLPIRDILGKQQGTKTQYTLRQKAKELGVSCVFVEPQHGHKDAEAVAKDLSVPTKTIDILAVESGTELPTYEAYIMGLARQFNACFL
jgi:zinc transport system substrate-binding protein